MFEASVLSRTFFPYIIIFNLLIIASSALTIDSIKKIIFSKLNFLKPHKKSVLLVSNTILISSGILLLILNSIDVIQNENSLNKIRSLEIKAEITLPTTEQSPVGSGVNDFGYKNLLILSTNNQVQYKLISDEPIFSGQTGTTTRTAYITYKSDASEKILGKQIEILDEIKTLYFNLNKVIELNNYDEKRNNSTSTMKFSFYINSIHVSTYMMTTTTPIKSDGGKLIGFNVSEIFQDISRRYDNMQRSKIVD